MEQEQGKVFISYSHYSKAHCELVLALADILRKYEIDAVIDQYEYSSSEGWPKWVNIQVKQAKFVLIICSKSYWERANGLKENGCGKGVYFESTIIYNQISADPRRMNRFIPVLFNKEEMKYVPAPVIGNISYCVDNKEGAEEFYRRLTHQPCIQKPELGKERESIPVDPKTSEFVEEVVNLVKEKYIPTLEVDASPVSSLSKDVHPSPQKEKKEVKKDPIFSSVREMLKDTYDFKDGLIATGTYSRVYLVHHKIFTEDHILKLMNFNLILENIREAGISIKEAFSSKKKWFEKEAQFFNAFRRNPNILEFESLGYVTYKYGEEMFEIPFILSKYIKGRSLKEFILKQKPLAWEHIYNLSGKILSTIEAIRQKGFFYWNIRPEKIIIEDSSYNPVLLDADMPEHISSLTDLTGTNIIINRDLYKTLSYLSPLIDRSKERETETASIICLFGLLLYEMVTQEENIRTEYDIFNRLNKKLNAPNPGIHGGIANVIRKAISRNPVERYKDIEKILKDLRDIKENIQE